MNVIFRKGVISDMPSVHRLIRELASFENEADAVDVTIEDLKKDGFGKQPLFNIFVAELDNDIVGMALFYPRYSTWKGPTIHLEDLIVTKEKRGLKIGSTLYKMVLDYAYKEGVERVEWAVLDWNEPAILFYESTGAKVLRDWDTAQIHRAEMKNYLKK
jgi:GNAT superfamily N-acetyltransferase